MTQPLTIVLDPGHGGPDPGAIAPTGLREADVNMALAARLHRELLRLAPHTPRLIPTHLGLGRTLQGRCWVANDLGADLFVSLHCNSAEVSEAHGYEIWTYAGPPNLADLVATHVYQTIRRRFPGHRAREDWSDSDPDKESSRLVVLRETHMPALLVEYGFLSNPNDCRLLSDPAALDELALATAEGLLEVLSDGTGVPA